MKTNRKPFNNEQREFIIENYLKMSSGRLATHLGCSKSKVQTFLKKEGLKVPPEVIKEFRRNGNVGRTTFTLEMDKVLKEDYLKVPVKQLARKLGKSSTGVRVRLRQLGLRIPKEIREQRKRDTQLKPGTIPPNKGKKIQEFMTPEQVAKFRRNQFKPGHNPHNLKYNGYERVREDGYVEVRIQRGVFIFKHRLIWERHNGKIPEGHVVVFKDGNRRNFNIDNLELISMRENSHRNLLKAHDIPQEVWDTQKIIWKINNKIKEHGEK